MLDALVIGGGPAGATAAALLARAGWAVALAEKSEFPRDKVCGGYVGPGTWPLLEELGLGEAFDQAAGPEIRRVGLFAGASQLSARMPSPRPPCRAFGRAMRRRNLDAMLLARAAHYGAAVHQPCAVVAVEATNGAFRCTTRKFNGEAMELRARLVIAAHGSWTPGPLVTQSKRESRRGSDLIGFKAQFRDARLPSDFMPLVAFRGGYGGMVNADAGRTTFSLCVRRDVLESCRARGPRLPAGEALLRAIADECAGVREALRGAVRDGPWLASGPVRPGVRRFYRSGIFVIGNAAGEAHPAIAEGIGMAMHSAALLCHCLLEQPQAAISASMASIAYEERWRERFGLRVAASRLFAQLAMRPRAMAIGTPLLRMAPSLLSFCATLSGKARFA